MTDFSQNLRLRVFAGPNGSGKSTVIQSVRQLVVNQHPIDFGIYINADDIASTLRQGFLKFEAYELEGCGLDWVMELASSSGLLSKTFTQDQLSNSIHIANNQLLLRDPGAVEQVAQIIAECLRITLLHLGKKFSFETVFSHPSKVEFMKLCAAQGYKVYFYFVGTESPEVNQFRVRSRVNNGGHPVPQQKIEERYFRSMDLLWLAAQHSYRAYFFDNSLHNQPSNLFANFKLVDGKKAWDTKPVDQFPQWFMKYYVQKARQNEGK